MLVHKSIDGDDAAVQGYAQPDISGTEELEHVVILLSIRIFIAAFYFWRDFRSGGDLEPVTALGYRIQAVIFHEQYRIYVLCFWPLFALAM